MLNKIKSKIKPGTLWWKIWMGISLPKKILTFHFNCITYGPKLINYELALKKNALKIENKIKQKNPKIHFVYFTCARHFEYLFASLKSLENINLKQLGAVYVYVDKKDLLSETQIKIINKEIKLKKIIKKSKYSLKKGLTRIISELEAFKEVSSKMNQNDYLAKVDSDILFISDKIFKKVLISKKKIVGQKYKTPFNGFEYTQGGCYFISNKIMPKILNTSIFNILKGVSEKTCHPVFKGPEDATIYELVKNHTDMIKFMNFYLPIERVSNITKKDKEKYSMIHFEGARKSRKKMLEVLNEQVLK